MGDALAQHRHAEMVSQQQRDQAKQTHAWDQAAGVSGQGEQATSSDVARRVRADRQKVSGGKTSDQTSKSTDKSAGATGQGGQATSSDVARRVRADRQKVSGGKTSDQTSKSTDKSAGATGHGG